MYSADLDFLRHVRDECDFLITASGNLSKLDFLNDEIRKRAFVRSLEIIGEAAKHVSAAFRQSHPQIPWRSVTGMRDRLIHDYLGVDYQIVWDAVTTKVPVLKSHVDRILSTP